MSRHLALVVLLLIPLSARDVSAQRESQAIGFVLSHSTRSETPFAQPLALTTLEVEWVLALSGNGWWGLEYAAAAATAVVQRNPTGRLETSYGAWVAWDAPPPETTLGVGLRPSSMRAWLGGRDLRLQAEVNGGFLYFGRPLLAANATRFNFTGSAGLGLRAAVGEGAWLLVGYRLQHVSNGGLGEVNPGMDAHQVYVGAWLR